MDEVDARLTASGEKYPGVTDLAARMGSTVVVTDAMGMQRRVFDPLLPASSDTPGVPATMKVHLGDVNGPDDRGSPLSTCWTGRVPGWDGPHRVPLLAQEGG